MSRRTALGAAILVAPALCLSGCGGSHSPPAAPDGNTLAYDAPFPYADEAKPNDGAATGPAAYGDPQVVELPCVKLPAKRVPSAGADLPSLGPLDARVTLQIWSDFECPFCAKVGPALRTLSSHYGGKLRIVFRNYPLPAHPHARKAANAALEAYVTRGGAAFFRMHDALFQAAASGFDDELFERLAANEKLDLPRFRLALANGSHDARISADIAAGDLAGIEGTPAFVINDRYLFGVHPYPILRGCIDWALAEAGAST